MEHHRQLEHVAAHELLEAAEAVRLGRPGVDPCSVRPDHLRMFADVDVDREPRRMLRDIPGRGSASSTAGDWVIPVTAVAAQKLGCPEGTQSACRRGGATIRHFSRM